VRAPGDGVVLKILQENETTVAAGTAIVEIGDPAALELVVDLLSEDAVRVSPGAQVEIVDWGGDTALAGHVIRVEPYGHRKVSVLGIEEQRVNVIVAIDTPAAARPGLGHGYRAEAHIVVWQAPQVLQAPVGALFRAARGWAVYAVEGGVATTRAITLGHRNARFAEVLSGLDEGARVVLYPSERVHDGARVAAREAES